MVLKHVDVDVELEWYKVLHVGYRVFMVLNQREDGAVVVLERVVAQRNVKKSDRVVSSIVLSLPFALRYFNTWLSFGALLRKSCIFSKVFTPRLSIKEVISSFL
jgi:hypothetical protein